MKVILFIIYKDFPISWEMEKERAFGWKDPLGFEGVFDVFGTYINVLSTKKFILAFLLGIRNAFWNFGVFIKNFGISTKKCILSYPLGKLFWHLH